MNAMRDTGILKKQYETDSNLKARISLHSKYSTNKQGFGDWIFCNYKDFTGSSVLELGCGSGDIWQGRREAISKYREFVISDFSEGILDAARKNIGTLSNVEYRTIDIEMIPYSNETFDYIIANMMLYHVPSLEKALSEVSRVLKFSGKFYCATFGENGLSQYITALFSKYGISMVIESSFTLQNGERKLSSFFRKIHRLDYQDSLEISNSEDLAEYILSMSTIMNTDNLDRDQIIKILDNEKDSNGIIKIPKEYGMFIAEK